MYSVISRYQQAIIGAIKLQYVTEYEWLCQSLGQALTSSYQQRYRNFWVMNVARLSGNFYTTYFGLLNPTTAQTTSLASLCQALYQSSTRSNGTQSLQFSFATKLLHVLNPQVPIYDSRVARFFMFQEPSSDLPLQQRISTLIAFHNFLATEYARVIASGQLAGAIAAFRQQFNPQQHTDEKIIDWLLWAFVGLADRGALLNGQIAYC